MLRRGLYGAAARLRTYESRDRFLAVSEPVVMLFRLVAWLGVGLAGFALVIWGVGTVTFGQDFVESGSSMFTLGFATEARAGPESVAFLAAAFGLLFVDVQIAYLPVLYGAFNRRETLGTMLESRAGSPPWGPELPAPITRSGSRETFQTSTDSGRRGVLTSPRATPSRTTRATGDN